MSRYSVRDHLSPAATSFNSASFSDPRLTSSAESARIFLYVSSAPGGGQTLDVFVQVSEDGVRFLDAMAFPDVISGVGDVKPLTIPKENLSKHLRLRYAPSGGGIWELEALLERKEEAA